MSTLFNLSVPKKEKLEKRHPWQATIKDNLTGRIKYAHNSVRNPEYPKKKEKSSKHTRLQFTIIGNRVTKEFLYCVEILQGLHKYRSKHFEPPIIRGVTGVEWPAVYRELKLKYGGITFCLRGQVAVLLNNQILGDEQDLKLLIEEKYNYYLVLDYYRKGVQQFSDYIRNSGRPCAYMHISIDGRRAGSFIFMLYQDILPYTCENFLRLCQAKKGGYSGTPIHRIVKDGWIQCGGFGLKDIEFDCENFIIPHDRRGLLCMANDGRHIDCSTQFFILLQPSMWMDQKYVAFGQLIDGEGTLSKVENVPTFYEAPKLPITIYDSGVLNLECQDIMINRGAVEYLQGHIENLYTLGEDLIQELMDRVNDEIYLRERNMIEELKGEMEGSVESEESDKEAYKEIHSTKRFIKKKGDFSENSNLKELQRSSVRSKSVAAESENNDFDVDVYTYEPEEYVYPQIDLTPIVKPDIPYYIPLTDVPYPGEKDSTYDLKKLLRGDYCLEADLDPKGLATPHKQPSIPSYILNPPSDFDICSEESLDSDDEEDIRLYLMNNVDRVSFAGEIIRNISRGKGTYNLFSGQRKSELLSDNELRRIKMALLEMKEHEFTQRKVSISVPIQSHDPRKIKRRQTGFVSPEDIEKVEAIRKSMDEPGGDEEDSRRKVRIDPSTKLTIERRLTKDIRESEIARPSVIARLYEEMSADDNPTLKDYRPLSEIHPKHLMLTVSSHSKIKYHSRDKFIPAPAIDTKNKESFETMLNIQHGKKCARKISSDYVKSIGQAEHSKKTSIRSVEFSRIRPSMTVAEYQQRNLQRASQAAKSVEVVVIQPELELKCESKDSGIIGDTPVNSIDGESMK